MSYTKGNRPGGKNMDKYLPFVRRDVCCKILLKDIMRIEQRGRMVAIVTENDIFERYGRIEELEPYLDERFYHCLKTVIINFQQVSMMRDQTIFFRNSEKIFLGRQNYIKARQTFAIYIKNPCNCNGFVV